MGLRAMLPNYFPGHQETHTSQDCEIVYKERQKFEKKLGKENLRKGHIGEKGNWEEGKFEERKMMIKRNWEQGKLRTREIGKMGKREIDKKRKLGRREIGKSEIGKKKMAKLW